jgi:DNA-binding NtrC family response regulator
VSVAFERGGVVPEDAPLPGMVGEHPLMKEVYRLVRRVAATDLPVLIMGETGTGKELVARALHELSGRRGILVAFNVAAIADTMLEDALFGHVKGAFTGAVSDAPGYLLEADGGTVFLDEIGSMELALQARLLRAIETHQFRPVGARADRRSDFRVVAATNADLRRLVRDGRFRRDLFERLNVVTITVPPLRARPSDIPLLASCLLGQLDHGALRLSEEAAHALTGYDWPGNVRELRNLVARLALESRGGVITPEAVSLAFSGIASRDGEPRRAQLAAALDRVGWDVELAAAMVGVSRATLYRWLRELGLRRPRSSHLS